MGVIAPDKVTFAAPSSPFPLGFLILVKDGVELMYQSRVSVQEDVASLAATPMGGTFLFVEVDDLDAVIAAIGVREPGGNAITFAQPVQA